MAKARAARERELALDRAARALSSGAFMYQDMGAILEQPAPPVKCNQPDPNTLDKMLPPSAPKLGEASNLEPPSWVGSPESQSMQSQPISGEHRLSSFPGTTPESQATGASNGFSGASSMQEFQEMTTDFGLEYLLKDVMRNTTYEGDVLGVDGTVNSNKLSLTNLPNTQAPSNVDGFVPMMQSPTTYTNSNGNANSQNSNGEKTDSPILGDGSMDWANWDDLVREYGMEGVQANMALNQNDISHLSMTNWF